MNRNSRIHILSSSLLFLLIVSCQFNRDTTDISEEAASGTINSTSNEEGEIIAAVEKIFRAAGNYNLEELDNLTFDKAVIGYTREQDGVWKNTEVTINEYIKNIENRELRPYIEIVGDYDILVTEERMALVRADAVVNRFGIPGLREVNHMILIKENKQWKLLSIGWTAHEQSEEKRKFDINIFAQGYAQAWSGKRPEFVAMFFEEDGSLQVNEGDSATGRSAISNVAQSFMTKFPDMEVRFDSLTPKPDGVAFHWTLTGTDADRNGKGHKVKISGFELWTMSKGNLIKDSKGTFSSEEYNRQLKFGIDN
ncbi:nuclear transport factor 2 family protein [Robiginitalea sp. SC105]|uniref:nuclear transport factor 2 family protein n=1 Tax=Robiginitalea sp. SC105 TaxID=2762332 RepID=UPI00163B5853|nr:nuclear transport factor 2 family protein [Robiginitalea sp. SC105]MBC2839724.1 ester cyclase [Robiginitalea sp. SC105]